MSGVDLTDQFLQYYSFLHKSVKWSKKFFVHCLNMVILNAHILHKKYSDSKITLWQFRIQLVKHMLSNAQQQPQGIVPVPDSVGSPLCLVDRHFIEPIPGQEGGRRKHPSCTCFICKCQQRGIVRCWYGGQLQPQKVHLLLVFKYKCALCIDPCFRLYHTQKDCTSEILKIARTSVKPIQKDAQHVQTDAQHV